MRRFLGYALVGLVASIGLACEGETSVVSDTGLRVDAADTAIYDAGRDAGDAAAGADADFQDTGADSTADASGEDTFEPSDTTPVEDTTPEPDSGCDPGYSPGGAGDCVADPVSDPATRTKQEVCNRWMGYSRQMTDLWEQEPADQCDWGVLHAQAQGDALRRLSLFRWLVGLDPVVSKPSYVEVTQACATTLAAESSGLTHSIPSSYACYTDEAASGASSSNIAMGVSEPAATVDLYIGDRGVASLGHRRWCLNPTMGATGFGQRGRYSCMYSFDRSQTSSVQHVLYPSAGFFPRDALLGVWSAGSTAFSFGSSPQVSVTKVADGSSLTVNDVSTLPYGYALNTISWQVPDAQVGVEYEVAISNGTDTLSYNTTLVSCP